MALVLADRIKETTTTAGAGTITLAGASTGYRSFATVGDGNTTYYTIAGQNTNEWEVGIGTYTAAGTTLSRTTVLSSSNAGSLVTFSAGTKDVFVTYPAGKSVNQDAVGGVTINAPTSGTALTLKSAAGDLAFDTSTTTSVEGRIYSTGSSAVSLSVRNADRYWQWSNQSGGSLLLYDATRAATVLSFNSAGNVSIAAPTSGTALTVSAFAGASSVPIASFLQAANGTSFSINSPTAAGAYFWGAAAGDTALRAETNNLCIGALSGNTTIGTGTRTIATFASAGNVTINAPTSGTALAVNGTCVFGSAIEVTNGSGSANAYLYLTGWNAGVAASAQVYSDYNGTINYAPAAGQNHYWRDGSLNIRMQMLAAGNVTINAPTSGTALTVSGAISAAGDSAAVALYAGGAIRYTSSNDTYLDYSFGGTTGTLHFRGTSSLRDVLDLGPNGNVTINAPSSGNALAITPSAAGIGLSISGSTTNDAFQIGNGTVTFGIQQDTSATYFGTRTNHGLSLFTNGTVKVDVAAAGNVTINAPTSGTALTANSPNGTRYAFAAVGSTASGGDGTGYRMVDGSAGNRVWDMGVALYTGTGIWELRDSTRGATVLYATSTGNVTINTPSSGDSLTITSIGSSNKAIQANGQVRADFSGVGQSLILTGTGSNLQINHDGTAAVKLFNSGGAVSITRNDGTTTALSVGSSGNVTIDAPTSGVTVTATGASAQSVFSANVVGNGISLYTNNGTATGVAGYYSGNTTFFGSTSAHYMGLLAGGVSRLTISDVGNVIVNTPDAGNTLLINNRPGQYVFTTSDGTCDTFLYTNTSGGAAFGTLTDHKLSLYSNNTERLILSNTGNVTINAPTTTGTALSVNGVSGYYTEYIENPGQAGVRLNTAGTTGIYTSYAQSGTIGGYIGIGASVITGAASTDLCLTSNGGNIYFGRTGGSAIAMQMLAAGNVTINAPTSGTALTVSSLSSNMALQLTGPTNYAQMQYIDGTVTAYSGIGAYAAASWNFGTASAHPSSWYTNGSARITVGSTGLVGIGATPAAWSGFVVAQVGVGAISNNGGGDYTNITTNAYYDGTNWRYIGAATATRYTQLIGAHNWYSAVTGTAGAVVSWTQPLTITNTGNVDIAAPTSGYALRVTAGFAATFSDGTGNYGIQMAGGAAYVGTTSNHLTSFRTNNTDRMYIAAAGNVVINAPGSGTALAILPQSGGFAAEFNAISGDSASVSFNSNGRSSGTGFQIYQSSAGTAWLANGDATHGMNFSTGGNSRMQISSSGEVNIDPPSTSGVALTVNGISGTHSTQIADSDSTLYDAGYLGIPQNAKTSAYVLVLADRGKHISITTGGVTVNASIFSAGDAVTVFNNSGSNQTITQGTSVTLRLGGTATTGSRTLAQYGVATLLCIVGGATPTFVIGGSGVT